MSARSITGKLEGRKPAPGSDPTTILHSTTAEKAKKLLERAAIAAGAWKKVGGWR